MPLIWAGLAIAGLFGVGYAADKTGEAAQGGASLVKWGAVSGGLYLVYRAAKSGGYLR